MPLGPSSVEGFPSPRPEAGLAVVPAVVILRLGWLNGELVTVAEGKADFGVSRELENGVEAPGNLNGELEGADKMGDDVFKSPLLLEVVVAVA